MTTLRRWAIEEAARTDRNPSTVRRKAQRRRARARAHAGEPAPRTPPAPPLRKPVAGPLFTCAVTLPVEGGKRHKLLCLLAAYADAGEHSPPAATLAEQVGLPKHAQRGIDDLLRTLERAGYLRVEWGNPKHHERNRYVVLLDGGAAVTR